MYIIIVNIIMGIIFSIMNITMKMFDVDDDDDNDQNTIIFIT